MPIAKLRKRDVHPRLPGAPVRGTLPQSAVRQREETFTAEGTFPVQNGKAVFELTLTATFQPKCSPPMSVVFGDVTVQDVEHGLSVTIPGPF